MFTHPASRYPPARAHKCQTWDQTDKPPSGANGMNNLTNHDSKKADDATAEHGEHRAFAAPLGSARAGRLEFARGASLVTIEASAMPDLYRARFEGPAPKIQARNGSVIVQYRRLSLAEWARYALLWGHHAAVITLTAAIPWQLFIRDGVSKLTADLRGLQLSGLTVTGGASEVALRLPRPIGVVAIRIAGGASNLALLRPAGVAAAIRVDGGASKLTFDDQHFGGVGGGIRLATPDAQNKADRYEIEIAGGASKLTVATR